MKANNLTVCVPNKGCDKNCLYCVSKMTFEPDSDYQLMIRNAKKISKMAEIANVTSILFTGKGEPFLNFYEMIGLMQKFKDFPIEIQTNGLLLAQRYEDFLPTLYREGVNTIAISIDDAFSNSMWNLIDRIQQYKINTRICFNVSSKFPRNITDLLKSIEGSVRQVIFRKISIPQNTKQTKQSDEVQDYIIKTDGSDNYNQIFDKMRSFPVLRHTVDGSYVFGYKNMSILMSDYCVQSSNNIDDIRSLIFHQDGHLYTSWDHQGSILF